MADSRTWHPGAASGVRAVLDPNVRAGVGGVSGTTGSHAWGSLRGAQGHRWTHPGLCGDPSPRLPPSLGTPECAGVDFGGIHQQREFGVLSRQIIPADPPSQLSTKTGNKKQSTIYIT